MAEKRDLYVKPDDREGSNPARFRAVEENAPWVRTVYLVTDHQIPDFLNTAHPKLRIVSNDEFIPAKYLPTFSFHPIELNFHRLPELSNLFVYFNDDTFINQPMAPENFFRDKNHVMRLWSVRLFPAARWI